MFAWPHKRPVWSSEAALKPYAEKTSTGDLSVIDGPCIGASAPSFHSAARKWSGWMIILIGWYLITAYQCISFIFFQVKLCLKIKQTILHLLAKNPTHFYYQLLKSWSRNTRYFFKPSFANQGTLVGWRMTNNGRSAGLHAPSGPAEQEAWFVVVRSAPLISGDVCFFLVQLVIP